MQKKGRIRLKINSKCPGKSVPFPLRFLLASQPAVMGRVLGIVYRAIATHLTRKAPELI